MTVKDLIEKLQAMPQDAPVIIGMYSEERLLDDNEPTLDLRIERNGIYMDFNPRYWDYKKDGEPKLITVCAFPGN